MFVLIAPQGAPKSGDAINEHVLAINLLKTARVIDAFKKLGFDAGAKVVSWAPPQRLLPAVIHQDDLYGLDEDLADHVLRLPRGVAVAPNESLLLPLLRPLSGSTIYGVATERAPLYPKAVDVSIDIAEGGVAWRFLNTKALIPWPAYRQGTPPPARCGRASCGRHPLATSDEDITCPVCLSLLGGGML